MGGLSLASGILTTGTGLLAVALRKHMSPYVFAAVGHVVLSGAVVSICSSDALCHKTARALGKDPVTGRFQPVSLFLLWPYHAALHLRLRLRRRASKEPLFNKALDGWYIGGWPTTAAALPEDCSVVDCTNEYPRVHNRPYLCVPTWDTTAVSKANIKRAVDFALAQRQMGRSVYVHCAHGHGRSLEVLLACLVVSHTFPTYQVALQAVKAQRPKCKLNAAQRGELEAFLHELPG